MACVNSEKAELQRESFLWVFLHNTRHVNIQGEADKQYRSSFQADRPELLDHGPGPKNDNRSLDTHQYQK